VTSTTKTLVPTPRRRPAEEWLRAQSTTMKSLTALLLALTVTSTVVARDSFATIIDTRVSAGQVIFSDSCLEPARPHPPSPPKAPTAQPVRLMPLGTCPNDMVMLLPPVFDLKGMRALRTFTFQWATKALSRTYVHFLLASNTNVKIC
jgi:hypothetical protein